MVSFSVLSFLKCLVGNCPTRKLSGCCSPPPSCRTNWEIPESNSRIWSNYRMMLQYMWTHQSHQKVPSIWLRTGLVSQHYHRVYLRLQSRRGTRFIYRFCHWCVLQNSWEFVFGLHLSRVHCWEFLRNRGTVCVEVVKLEINISNEKK